MIKVFLLTPPCNHQKVIWADDENTARKNSNIGLIPQKTDPIQYKQESDDVTTECTEITDEIEIIERPNKNSNSLKFKYKNVEITLHRNVARDFKQFTEL